MKKKAQLLRFIFIIFVFPLQSCITICTEPYENCKLTEEEKSNITLTDTVQNYKYTYQISIDSSITDTLEGLNRFILKSKTIYNECSQSKYQIAKNGLKLSKNDSIYLIDDFEISCYSYKEQLITGGALDDTLRINGNLYNYVFLRTEQYGSDSAWFAKGIGFVLIKSNKRKYELIPE